MKWYSDEGYTDNDGNPWGRQCHYCPPFPGRNHALEASCLALMQQHIAEMREKAETIQHYRPWAARGLRREADDLQAQAEIIAAELGR